MNIYVGNIPYTTTEEDLRNIFAEHGGVVSVKIITHKYTGRSKGFGFVEMESDDAATKAVDALDGFEVNGRNLRVDKAHDRDNKTAAATTSTTTEQTEL